jgi:3'-phosphoadenosine 5'-phosphosulfate sulfotransferase (PAPS reductase)/FAD synthetase
VSKDEITALRLASAVRQPDVCVVAAVSGGKDSTAMCLWLTEQGIPHRRVFADTGWEADETYAYLDVLRERLGPIDVVRNEKLWSEALPGEAGMLTLVRHKQAFPSRLTRFCTTFLKVNPIKAYIERTAEDGPVINAVGVRAAESRARADLPEWEWSDAFDCQTWRPLIRWTEQDVIDIHQRHGLPPNPLYLGTARRVGCYPCIFASKEEIAALPEARVEQIAGVERELTADAVARGVERPGRSFFHMRGDPVTGATGFVPIERVREWAKTDRGGAQMRLLETADPGCMRWGLCDTTGRR